MQGRTPLLETLRELECEIRLLTVYARECCGCYEILRRKLDRLSGLIGEDCSRAQWQADSDDPALAPARRGGAGPLRTGEAPLPGRAA